MFSILLIPFLVAMFLAMNMGGSGTAPTFSAAYGANLIKKELIPGLFGIAVFAGAILAGKKVTLTLSKGILPPESMTLILTTIILLSVSISMFLANILKIPQSTSQATVFSLLGPAIYFDNFNSEKVFFEIIPTWFILPVVAFIISYGIGRFIFIPINEKVSYDFSDLAKKPVIRWLVIIASLYVGFAIGSNNVANAAGPIAAMMKNTLNVPLEGDEFTLILIASTLIIAPCFGIGSSLFGGKVIETTGKGIIAIGPLGATLISIVTATLLLLASVTKGIPTSLVQMNVAAIIGLGISRFGWAEIIKQSVVKKMVSIWIIAPVIALLLSFLLTLAADKFGMV